MRVEFKRQPHPRVEERKKSGPPSRASGMVGFNSRIALTLTNAVGTMWCAYAFACLALLVLPQAIGGGLLALVQWISQTFIQLVMLSVIMVGQNILGRAADKRALMTYKDADATFHEVGGLHDHLKVQDDAINTLLAKVEQLEATLARS